MAQRSAKAFPIVQDTYQSRQTLGELRNDIGEQGKFTKKKTSALVLLWCFFQTTVLFWKGLISKSHRFFTLEIAGLASPPIPIGRLEYFSGALNPTKTGCQSSHKKETNIKIIKHLPKFPSISDHFFHDFSKNHNTWRCQGEFSRRKYPTLVMTLGLKVFPEDR